MFENDLVRGFAISSENRNYRKLGELKIESTTTEEASFMEVTLPSVMRSKMGNTPIETVKLRGNVVTVTSSKEGIGQCETVLQNAAFRKIGP